jgi:hypothetical protein
VQSRADVHVVIDNVSQMKALVCRGKDRGGLSDLM